jgi:hypothetical protein
VAYSPRSKHLGRIILPCVTLVAAAMALAACDTPVGTPPSWRNLPLPPTQVTNPDGGGPQVTRWGPPDTSGTGRGR